jgi:hypothetical protein
MPFDLVHPFVMDDMAVWRPGTKSPGPLDRRASNSALIAAFHWGSRAALL